MRKLVAYVFFARYKYQILKTFFTQIEFVALLFLFAIGTQTRLGRGINVGSLSNLHLVLVVYTRLNYVSSPYI